jgi:hypothetical protein
MLVFFSFSGGLEFDQQHSIVNHRPENYQLPEAPIYNGTLPVVPTSFMDSNPLIKNSSNSKRESQPQKTYEDETTLSFIPLHGVEHNHRLHRK